MTWGPPTEETSIYIYICIYKRSDGQVMIGIDRRSWTGADFERRVGDGRHTKMKEQDECRL